MINLIKASIMSNYCFKKFLLHIKYKFKKISATQSPLQFIDELEIDWIDFIPQGNEIKKIKLKKSNKIFTTEHHPAISGDIIYITNTDPYSSFATNDYIGRCFVVSTRCSDGVFTPGVFLRTNEIPWKLNDNQYLTLKAPISTIRKD